MMTLIEKMVRVEELALNPKPTPDAKAAADAAITAAKAAAAAEAPTDAKTPADAQIAAETEPPFTIRVTDKNGRRLPDEFDPTAHEARGIEFDIHINQNTEPTAAQMEFYHELAKIEHAINYLYPDNKPSNEAKFRPHFNRLFHLARLILEGDVRDVPGGKPQIGKRLPDEAAKVELAAFANDLIDDEAPRIKNGHLRDLAQCAGRLSLPFLAAYVMLTLFAKELTGFLVQLHIFPVAAANFMLLWVGTFFGVCLSYAIRTHKFSLSDLTKTDIDYVAPRFRLILTGAFAMVLVLLGIAGLGDIEFGSVKLSYLGYQAMPMLAFVLGAVLGISEQNLSSTIEKRAGSLFGGVTK